MSKHTPGPWFATEDERQIMAAREGVMECIAEALRLWEGEKFVFSDEAKANARLIAAAPDLLATLEIIASLSMSQFYKPEGLGKAAISFAAAAIAKATGEQP